MKTQKLHSEFLLNLHIKFQLPSLIWRADKGVLIFKVKKVAPITSLLINIGEADFWICNTNLDSLSIGSQTTKTPSPQPIKNLDVPDFWPKVVHIHHRRTKKFVKRGAKYKILMKFH